MGRLVGIFIYCGDVRYTLGSFRFSDLFNVLDETPKAARSKIHKIFSLYEVEKSEFSYELFECVHCDTAHTRLHVIVIFDKGKTYSPNYRCSDCRRKLQKSKRKLSTFKCRSCGLYEKHGHDLLWISLIHTFFVSNYSNQMGLDRSNCGDTTLRHLSSEKFEFIKSKYQFWSSWAIWADEGDTPKSNIGDLSVLDPKMNSNLLSILNPFVLVALNISRAI